MTDVHDIETRSYNMSRIKGTNTKPEIIVRKFLYSNGLRYRLHNGKLPGKPDIVLKKYHTIIFVNGCFWHGHEDCKYFVLPKTRSEWWMAKIEETKRRDTKTINDLKLQGWNIIVLWECELKPLKRNITLENVLKIITKN